MSDAERPRGASVEGPGQETSDDPPPTNGSAAPSTSGSDPRPPSDEPAPPLPEHPRWLLPLIGVSIVAMVAANQIANATWATLIDDQPYALLALNSSNKYLIGTTPNSSLALVLVVATLRLLAPDPLFWMIGHLYRERAEHWARRVFPGMNKVFDQFDAEGGGFARTLDVLLVIMPNNPVCLLAGVAGVRFRRMMLLSLVGTVGRVLLMRLIGTVFEDEIESLLDFVAQYQSWFQRISIGLVVLFVAWQFFGRRGLIGGVEELEEELGD
jgi:membrane protein YqaA with SNARE-associated domain